MKRTSILVTATIAIFFVSCQNAVTGLPIPKDAAIVVHINGYSLNSKLSWKEIQADQWFKDEQAKEDDSLTKKLMDDPESSGVNIKSDFAFFLKKEGRSGYMAFEGNLKDAAAFEATVKKIHHNANIQKDGDLNYMKAEGTDLLSWTNSKFILLSDVPMNQRSLDSNGDYEKSRFHQDSLLVFAKDLLSLSKSNSLESDDRFTSLIKENGDLHFWMNMEQYMSSMQNAMGNNPIVSMMQNMGGNMFRGTVSTGTLSFDDGKVSVKTKKYLSDEMKNIMNKYKFQNVTEDEVNRIPSGNVDAAFVLNYPPDASKEFLKTMGVDGFINGMLGKFNTNLDELISATKGQFILSVSDFNFNKIQKTNTEGNEGAMNFPFMKPDVNVLVGISINNKASFDKLINIAHEQIKDSGLWNKIHFKTTNDWFAASNSSDEVDQFLAGNNKQPFASKITGHPFGAYIDLQKLIGGFHSLANAVNVDSSATNIWQDVVATGGDYNNGIVTGEFTVNLVDKNTNSLKQINQAIDKMYQSQQKKRNEMMDRFKNDSTATRLPSADSTVKPQ